jgi:hypothetical protein
MQLRLLPKVRLLRFDVRPSVFTSTTNPLRTPTSGRQNTAVRNRDAHIVLEALLPNAGESKADCAGHAADARTQDQQPNRGIHPNGNR